jgi:hypothetical protein
MEISMQTARTAPLLRDAPPRRVLLVPDWKLDPHAVVDACRAQYAAGPATFALLVPARLHGLDWIGDPYASVPCAARALAEIAAQLESAGLPVQRTVLGDHDPIAAIVDATLDEPVDEVVICEREGHVTSPFDLAHRVRRVTGLHVAQVALPDRPAVPSRRVWPSLRGGHCPVPEAQAA